MVEGKAAVALSVFLLLMTGVTVRAEEADRGKRQETILYTVTDEGEAVITGGRAEEGTVIIPPEIDGFPVAGIGEEAFLDRTDIRKVVVESGVRYIAAGAFAGCTEIGEIELGEGLQYIGEKAFRGDAGIREILLPESLTYVGAKAFGDCSELVLFQFPQRAYVDDYAFEGSAWQAERDGGKFRIRGSCLMDARGNVGPVLEIPYGVTEMADFSAFDINPPALLDKDVEYEEVILPDTLVKLGECCFNHTQVRKMRIPAGVKEIPVGTFFGSALSEITLSQGIESIGEYAFGETLLTEIQLPDTLRRIEGFAFFNTENIRRITIPASVRYIGSYAFESCKNLSELVFEEGITVVAASAYLTSGNLERLQFPESTKIVLSGGHFYPHLQRMYIPEGASYIEEGLLNNFINQGLSVVIYGQEGSRAQELAEEFGMEFVSVGSGDDMP